MEEVYDIHKHASLLGKPKLWPRIFKTFASDRFHKMLPILLSYSRIGVNVIKRFYVTDALAK